VSSLTALAASAGGSAAPTPELIAGALDQMPAAIRTSLVSDDRRAASVTLNLAPMSIADMARLIDAVQSDAQAPGGVSVRAAGTATLMTSVVGSVTDRRLEITIAGFLAVFVGLLLIYRNPVRALVPVVPIVLVTGWSSAVMWIFGIELNPLTAVMSALIVGIGTEFAVMLLGRYWEELDRRSDPREAMNEAVRRIGPAIAASGLTVVAGFAALAASSFPAIREFGLVTVFDVLLSLVATLVVVPPLAVALLRRTTATEPRLVTVIRSRFAGD
jgi:uncharacterized protein